MDFLDLDTSLKITKQNSVLYSNWLVNHAADLVELSQNSRSAFIKENIGFVESNPAAIISYLKKSGLVDSQLRTSLLSYLISNRALTYNEYCLIHLSKESLFLKNVSTVNALALTCKFIIQNSTTRINLNEIRELGLDLKGVPGNVNANKRTDYLSAILEGTGLFSFVGKKEDGIMDVKKDALPIISFLNSCNLKNCDYALNSDERFDYFSSCNGGIFDYLEMELPEIWREYYPHLNGSFTFDKSVVLKDSSTKLASLPLQQIFYGAPGTGKSHTIDKDTNESNRIRTTFHPDYDYATFVGAYKPTVKKVDRYGLFGKDTVTLKHEDNTPIKEDVIVYKFIPQAFIKAYIEAWRRYANEECTDKDFYLVIEEINRGNCAQIFGDLFQLLDRTNAGFSSYAVETESDLQSFLTTDEEYKLDIVLTEDIKNDNGKVIATAENVMNGKVLVLPPNLHIWATMNTSDQSLFPIDSAFKRRWDWKYVPIKYDNTEWKVMLGDKEVCKWTELQQTLNDLIYDATESEDKMLGDWFVKADGKNEINEEQLVGKIIFYLWNDVAKVDAGKLFDLEVEKHGRKRKIIFSDFYNTDETINSAIVKEWLKNIIVLKDETTEDETPNEPEQ